MDERPNDKEYCFSSDDPVPKIDTLLTTFVEGISYLQNHPNRKDGCFYLLKELLKKMEIIASTKEGVINDHVGEMNRALKALQAELNEEHYQRLREACLKLQNDLLRL